MSTELRGPQIRIDAQTQPVDKLHELKGLRAVLAQMWRLQYLIAEDLEASASKKKRRQVALERLEEAADFNYHVDGTRKKR